MKKFYIFLGFSALFLLNSCRNDSSNTVKIGILHSLTGTMAMSERPLRDAELLAVNEINKAGGVLGRQIKVIQEDGQSDAQVFSEKAKKLLKTDGVATVFGCWTSASRKAVKPVFEEFYGLLWYPLQYEGLEASPNIMYIGAAPNQQVVPAVDFCAREFGKRMFLVGSDYIFPKTANKIIKAQLKDMEGSCIGEEYVPLGSSNFLEIIKKIKESEPDVIINSLNGDSNAAFFKQLSEQGISSEKIPVMSLSIAEEEIYKIGTSLLSGNYLCWNYFENTKTEENRRFVSSYKDAYGLERKSGAPIETAYTAVYLWAAACEKAGTFDVEEVRIAAKWLSFSAPEGNVTIDGSNQHVYKTVRIGKINESGMIDEVWSTEKPIKPDPYLSTYAWARGL